METKNKTIWKFPLKPIDVNRVQMPVGSQILSAELQDGVICMWALVDPEAEIEIRKFGLIGTGAFIKQEKSVYIATLQLDKIWGTFNQVYHLFEF
ncbi:hypothetical protein G6N05_05310 [Flavobacterium sp. F372]|uniref:DUF7352 domain-containing protein n=1 Tax=Flavobacterium bernardetii TaxID=2813823 RepID=A0ABR7J1A4_9FLAO|nr:hypothetical protein [Flavobacterium bernardetii]MBC5835798.1 hypothetical protein [Flavobacterium bernardetii]NHF69529.1 hypothetical protein [Flavobacterium bernardetii]